MNWLSPEEMDSIRFLSCAIPDKESCGFVLTNGSVVVVENTANDPVDEFAISPDDYLKYEGRIRGVWHSHLTLSGFSQLDQQVLSADILPWAVYCMGDDTFHQCNPEGSAPLLGRPFVFGVYDCYSLVRDKLTELGVDLPAWERGTWGEWNTPAFSAFDDTWRSVGRPVTNGRYQEGDILLLNLGDYAGHTDHVGVFTSHRIFIHHAVGQRSREQVFGSYWSRRLNWVVRPNELWNDSEKSNF